jgi:hypothetical protein
MSTIDKNAYELFSETARTSKEDGLQMEIIIKEVSLIDWQKLLSIVQKEYKFTYLLNGVESKPPDNLSEDSFHKDSLFLGVELNNFTISCNFFTLEEIELNLNLLTDLSENFDDIFLFIRTIGEFLHKPVYVSVEGTKPIISYTSGKFVIEKP